MAGAPGANVGGVLRLPASALEGASGPPGLSLLQGHLAIHYEAVLGRRACADRVRGVYAGREAWTPNFDGIQFTLGRAYYVHLETDREDEYFDCAREADASVERFVPGLASEMRALVARFVGAEVVQRPDFCGPGVHVFPSGEHVSRNGGDVHFDLEGLTEEQIARRAPALTAVLMLQPAAEGGGLRVWARRWEDEETPEQADDSVQSESIRYGAGDLVILDSYRLHQICASRGPLDRISATVHAVLEPGGWQAWF